MPERIAIYPGTGGARIDRALSFVAQRWAVSGTQLDQLALGVASFCVVQAGKSELDRPIDDLA